MDPEQTSPPASRPEHERALSDDRRVRQLFFPSPAGQLEAVLFCRVNESPQAAAVFCHPHPQYAGTMHNKVAYRASEAIFERGLPVLRFNFRGVGQSEGAWGDGVGEEEDAIAAIDFLRSLYPQSTTLLGGFSFGAGIALAVGAREDRVAAMLAVAPGAGRRDFSFLERSAKPKGVVQGTDDELCPMPNLQAVYPKWAEPKALRVVDGAPHFFDRHMPELKTAVQSILDEPAFASSLRLGAKD
jgi:alpha/beta superfamily hydrolase